MVYLHALLNMGHSWPLFLHFSLFNTVDGKCSMTFFADDWIWIVDLWFWKWPLYQLSHCQCPTFILWLHLQKNKWDLNLNHHSALTSRAPTRPYLYFLLAELQLNVFLVHLSLLAPPRWTPPPRISNTYFPAVTAAAMGPITRATWAVILRYNPLTSNTWIEKWDSILLVTLLFDLCYSLTIKSFMGGMSLDHLHLAS